nr:pyruvate decarboxylase [Quercus suber]
MTDIPLGRYLWERIHQIGINHIFGVPGDFNLTLLDHIYDVDGLEWIGNTNELNAAYAADGYARVRRGAACIVTTHGVGELSALNGIAGSMTEQIKVIHVVGQTSTQMQKNKMMIHHSIGPTPDHQLFNKASQGFRCAAAELQAAEGATEEIDRVLRELFIQSKPVYIFVPIDLVDVKVPAKALDTPLDLVPPMNESTVAEASKSILEALASSQNPSIFVDCLVDRHGAVDELKQLVDALKLPIYASNMSKGIIDEDYPYYVGLYNGAVSHPGIEDAAQASDLVITIGNLPSDTNTGGFTRQFKPERSINIDPQAVVMYGGKQIFHQVPIKAVLSSLLSHLPTITIPQVSMPALPERIKEDDLDSLDITQSWIWHRLAAFMQPDDVVFGETGTAAFGIPDATLPPSTQWITQTYYGSIGWATPAAFGADLALTDLAAHHQRARGRTLLLTGDGSLMLTVQEIGNMVKQRLAPLVIIINNAGYTIERVIHGAQQSYNDIVPFNYAHLLSLLSPNLADGASQPSASQGPALGGVSALPSAADPRPEEQKHFHRAATKAELEAVLALPQIRRPQTVEVLEILLDPLDVPWRLSSIVAMRGPESVRELLDAGFKVRELQTKGAFWK